MSNFLGIHVLSSFSYEIHVSMRQFSSNSSNNLPIFHEFVFYHRHISTNSYKSIISLELFLYPFPKKSCILRSFHRTPVIRLFCLFPNLFNFACFPGGIHMLFLLNACNPPSIFLRNPAPKSPSFHLVPTEFRPNYLFFCSFLFCRSLKFWFR